MLKIYHPTYPKFFCLAGDCNMNCCEYFRVLFFRWEQNLFDSRPEWRDADGKGSCMRKFVNESNGAYSLSKNSSGRCVFLNGEKLCSLQRKNGITALPSVCRTYPRLITRFPDRIEYALDPCCAQVLFLMKDWKPGEIIIEGGDEPDDKEYILRKQAMELLADESHPVCEAIREMAAIYGLVWNSRDISLQEEKSEFLRRAICTTIWAYILPYSGHHIFPNPMKAIILFLDNYISDFSDAALEDWNEMSSHYSETLSDFTRREGFDDEIEGRYVDLLQEQSWL